MPDIFTPEKRSDVMSRIRGKNTKPELLVFTYLRARGVYFQKHYKRAPGNPDIALPRKKKAVFIDGDFWHGRKFGAIQARLGHNEYWMAKITRNIKRDQKNRRLLKQSGWQVLRVWEHDLATKPRQRKSLEKILAFLTEK